MKSSLLGTPAHHGNRRISGTGRFRAILLMLSLVATPALAENIDPDGNGSSFAWGENVGWLNAEPGGNGGPGLEVEDFPAVILVDDKGNDFFQKLA